MVNAIVYPGYVPHIITVKDLSTAEKLKHITPCHFI